MPFFFSHLPPSYVIHSTPFSQIYIMIKTNIYSLNTDKNWHHCSWSRIYWHHPCTKTPGIKHIKMMEILLLLLYHPRPFQYRFGVLSLHYHIMKKISQYKQPKKKFPIYLSNLNGTFQHQDIEICKYKNKYNPLN